MLCHEFITISPCTHNSAKIDYEFFVKNRSNKSVIHSELVLSDDVVLENYGFKRDDFLISGMTTEKFFPELMKFFSSFIAYTPEDKKIIGLAYWGITLFKQETLQEVMHQGSRAEVRSNAELLRFVKFCADALQKGLFVIHFGV